MTLGHAASLIETYYNPPSGPAAVPITPTVNALMCRCCKGKDHKLSDCPKKETVSDKKRAENPMRLHQLSPVQPNARGSLVLFVTLWITCLTCVLVVRKQSGVSLSPPAGRIHHLLQTGGRLLVGARQSEAGGVRTNFRRVLSDGVVRDEVTQLRSLRKLRFCL